MSINGLVTIRTWADMEDEYGWDNSGRGSINCSKSFVSGMERDLPPNRIIEVINGNWGHWTISQDMIQTRPKYLLRRRNA